MRRHARSIPWISNDLPFPFRSAFTRLPAMVQAVAAEVQGGSAAVSAVLCWGTEWFVEPLEEGVDGSWGC